MIRTIFRNAASVLFFLSHLISEAQSGPNKTYTNPLPVAFGDPYVLKTKTGTYYMYGTGGAARNGFAAYSSTDLTNWKDEGQVWFNNNPNGWSDSTAAWEGAYWAPEVYERAGKYYLFYSAQWKENPTKEVENFRIGVAVAESPSVRSLIWRSGLFLIRAIPSLTPMCSLTTMAAFTFIIPVAVTSIQWKAM